jgi:hypothetical protein
MTRITMVLMLVLLTVACAWAGRVNDVFASAPDEPGRAPFTWWKGALGFTVNDGTLEMRVEDSTAVSLETPVPATGIVLSSDTEWTLEAGFEHVAGEPSRPAYEAVAYVRWPAAEPGRMHILAIMYDDSVPAVSLYNGTGAGDPLPVDLSDGLHAVRMAVADGRVRLWVDGEPLGEPVELRDRAYGTPPAIFLGSLTHGEEITLHCRWDYFALTDDGAFAPGEGDWHPAEDKEPVAQGVTALQSEPLPENEDTGITLIAREKGSATWNEAMPEMWRGLSDTIRGESREIEAPFYDYPDADEPPVQNIYPDVQALDSGDGRGIGVAMLTRGVGDTATGYVDYKLWYRVTTDGGETWDDLRPVVVEGEEFSPAHPNPFVWIGKNGYCYASIPPMLQMSNGEVLMPFYFAPLDEDGGYYNPINAYTFGYVACLIGGWNEAGDDVIWDCSESVEISERKSSRGFSEAAITELSEPGHLLMALRGSNAPDPWGNIPAVKWRSLSTDYGRTWSEPEPFTYEDGAAFMSPSTCSAFHRSSKTGKVYWIGNISRVLPQGNSPRYPLVIAELDEETLSLRRDTVTIIDDRGPDDPSDLQLSNFKVLEQPETGRLLVYLSRWMRDQPDHPDEGPHTYVIEVD